MLGGNAIRAALNATRRLVGDGTMKDVKGRAPRRFLNIVPLVPDNIGPNSVDLRLSDEPIRIIDREALPVDVLTRQPYVDLDMPLPTVPVPWRVDGKGKFVIIKPWQLYLASTLERTETHGVVPQLAGRSGIGRRGLFVHVTAGFGDDGFCGRWTLELLATQAVMLRPERRICQVWFDDVEGESQTYNGSYQDQQGIVAPPRGVNERNGEAGVTDEIAPDGLTSGFPGGSIPFDPADGRRI